MKSYDEAYFSRWYRGPGAPVSDDLVGQRARLALAAAEYVLARDVRSVLDVGCGEGRWRAPLRRARPGIAYVGVDGSDYAVRRYGRRRNIQLGTFGSVGRLGLRGRFDLVVCSDVLQYVTTAELRRGLPALGRLARGVLWLDTYTSDDEFIGDREGWQRRSERTYRRIFAEAGLVSCGLNCWVPRRIEGRLTALERGK
ncbi:MAG: class I SAM-dependent methyltransferase [Gemmatimonadales bacterium]